MSNNTIYVVSGYMRSGTSMMMHALVEGGMTAAFDIKRNELNTKYGDKNYKPNPDGFYELSREEYKALYFPLLYSGKLIKCLMGGLHRFPASDYRMVFMLRDPEEIRQSYSAFFELDLDMSKYDSMLKAVRQFIKGRPDIKVTYLWYRDVLENPLATFKILALNGWDIDAHKAASTVDSKQCRFKLEKLTPGI